MSKGDWLRDVAVGLIIFVMLCAAFGGVLLIHRVTNPQGAQGAEEAHQQAQTTDALLRACLGLTPIEKSPPSEQCESAREQADLEAQQSMANAAWSQLALNILGLILVGATVLYAHRAWEQAQRGADAAVSATSEAKRQADIAHAALVESRQPAIYVGMHGAEIDRARVPVARIEIANLGSNLAVITGGKAVLRFGVPGVVSKEQIEAGRFTPIVVGVQALASGRAAGLIVDVPCLQFPSIETHSQAFDLMEARDANSPTFVCIGWVEYRDQWRNKYEEPFGMLYHPPAPDESEGTWGVLDIGHIPVR